LIQDKFNRIFIKVGQIWDLCCKRLMTLTGSLRLEAKMAKFQYQSVF